MKPIRLGVDARDAFAGEPRGVGRTLGTLVRHVMSLVPDWRVTLYTNREHREGPASAHLRWIDLPGDRLNAWERVRLPFAALTDRLDLLHCPSQTAPPVVPCPVVLTVHDVIPVRIGDGWSRHAVDRFRRDFGRSVRRARRIIAVSEFTRRDLLDAFPVREDKVDVVRWGVERRAAPPTEEHWDAVCNAHGVRRPYFFAFGGEAPRKNVPRVLAALATLVREVSSDLQLVLVGVRGPAAERFGEIASDLGISKHVITLGYASEATVGTLLANAEALVFPSLYEGFGLPLLEAMAAGTPVITSNVTSMPEIAGDAALLVDPTAVGEIAEAMRACHVSDRLKEDLRARGRRRIENFRWERTAAETRHTYERALGLRS
jgi:glycosyltransferase involved in cell wall biosynthesis